MGLLTDERLARLVGQGREDAFVELYDRYHQRLFRYCRPIVGTDPDAQDALQTTFTRALVALREGRRDAPIRPWLYRIAHNESISLLRRRRPERELPEELTSTAPAAHEVADERAQMATLLADLAELPDRQRGALVMRELSGLAHEEIAAAFGISAGAAKQTIFEARRALQEFAEGRIMDCDEIQRLVSDGDGRALRARRMRAHLRDCGTCAAFAAAIPTRQAKLRALTPALPSAAAAGLLARITGGGGAAGVAAGGSGGGAAVTGVGTLLSGKALITGAAALIATAVIGTEAVQRIDAHPSPPSQVAQPGTLAVPSGMRGTAPGIAAQATALNGGASAGQPAGEFGAPVTPDGTGAAGTPVTATSSYFTGEPASGPNGASAFRSSPAVHGESGSSAAGSLSAVGSQSAAVSPFTAASSLTAASPSSSASPSTTASPSSSTSPSSSANPSAAASPPGNAYGQSNTHRSTGNSAAHSHGVGSQGKAVRTRAWGNPQEPSGSSGGSSATAGSSAPASQTHGSSPDSQDLALGRPDTMSGSAVTPTTPALTETTPVITHTTPSGTHIMPANSNGTPANSHGTPDNSNAGPKSPK